jgi:hypothetical protein
MKRYKEVFKRVFCGYVKLIVWELLIGFIVINSFAVWYAFKFVLENVSTYEVGGLMCVMFTVIAAKVYSSC